MFSKDFLSEMKEKLLEEKKQVEEKIEKYSKPEEGMENPDWDDLGNDAVEDIMEEKIVDNHRRILEKINRALNKINDGTYGKCEFCDASFNEDQLKQVPWADPCNKCNKE